MSYNFENDKADYMVVGHVIEDDGTARQLKTVASGEYTEETDYENGVKVVKISAGLAMIGRGFLATLRLFHRN